MSKTERKLSVKTHTKALMSVFNNDPSFLSKHTTELIQFKFDTDIYQNKPM